MMIASVFPQLEAKFTYANDCADIQLPRDTATSL